MKKKDLIVIIIFISFITLPGIIYWFIGDKMDHSNYESRTLATKPELTFKDITRFPQNYENYFNDNIAFKNEIRNTRLHILNKYLKTNGILKIIEGEDGWLFYNSDLTNDGDTIRAYRKTSIYTKKEKEKVKSILTNVDKELSKKDIDFYILVAPNRENVYSDKLEKIIKRSNNKYSKTEDLINYLNKNTSLNIVYPKDELIKNRITAETCYKYDTHWNGYGAYIGTMELMKKIDNEFKSTDIEIEYKEEPLSYGLAIMNMTPNVHSLEPQIKNFYDNINVSCEPEGELNYCESDDSIYDKTIMIVGDSFRDYLVQFISKIYKKSIFIHKNIYNGAYMEKYNPDIVVYEVVERYSGNLFDADILLR